MERFFGRRTVKPVPVPSVTLKGHTASVRSCGFSPDGAWVVSGSRDDTLRLWNAATGECLRTLEGHINWVWSCGFSPDGARVVSGSRDKALLLWTLPKDLAPDAWFAARFALSRAVAPYTLDDACTPTALQDVLEMRRNGVCDDANLGCSSGFHAGSYEYAKGYASNGGNLMIVEINPADVVSVPYDCSCQKLRTSKYKVVGHYETIDAPPLDEGLNTDFYDYDEELSDYDEGYEQAKKDYGIDD